MSSLEDWPSEGELTAELKELQQLLDRPNEQWFLQIPGTMRIARHTHPAKRDMESLRDTLRLAVVGVGANSWADSIRLLYGLDEETEGESLEVRQQLSFERSGEGSMNTFRQVRRNEMARTVALLLLELAKDPGGFHRGEAVTEPPSKARVPTVSSRPDERSHSGWEAFWRGSGGYMPIWVEIAMAVAFVLVVLGVLEIVHL